MLSFSSFLIALLAVSPEPSTWVLLHPTLASLSASLLPRIPMWALTHSRTTVFFLPSAFRLSLVSNQRAAAAECIPDVKAFVVVYSGGCKEPLCFPRSISALSLLYVYLKILFINQKSVPSRNELELSYRIIIFCTCTILRHMFKFPRGSFNCKEIWALLTRLR
jgi:hypothetical protein